MLQKAKGAKFTASEEFKSAVSAIQALEAEKAMILERLESLTDLVKRYMLNEGVDAVEVEGATVRYTPYTSKRFDTTTFKAENPDMYKEYLKETESRRFSIN